MIPNPIYEGLLYESIQPEFSTLTTPGSATNIPIHPVMLNEPSKNSDNIGESGTPNQRNGEEHADREAPFMKRTMHTFLPVKTITQ